MGGTAPIRYLDADQVWAINEVIVRRDGGVPLLRDRAALESAVQRPRWLAHYEHADLVAQAAALIAGVALAHAFLDANKRTAAAAGALFLELNDSAITDEGSEFGRAVEAVVVAYDRQDAVVALIAWLRGHLGVP